MATRRNRDRGIALILALLLLTILILLIGQMAITSLHNRTISENQLSDLQNTYGTRSGYQQALLYLKADLEKAAATDSANEKWAAPIEFDLGRARVKVTIEDSERFINLSQVVNDKGEVVENVAAQLRRLVQLLRHPPDIAERIIDYIDGDSRGSFETKAANRRLVNLEELFRIEGLTPEVMYGGTVDGEEKKGILPFLTIWPKTLAQGQAAVLVNINTAPVEVLVSLSDAMTRTLAGEIVQYRGIRNEDGTFQEFKSTADLKKVPGMTDEIFVPISGRVTVRSNTFEIKVRSSVGNIEKAWVYGVSRSSGSGGQTAGGTTLLASQRINDFLSTKPSDEEKK